ncbi:MAG: hypothetical protein ABMA15_20585 [Vicinamibacterales bacterium]
MSDLTAFKAVSCSGFSFPDAGTVPALALVFERIRIPSNARLIKELVRSRPVRVRQPEGLSGAWDLRSEPWFSDLTDSEIVSVEQYFGVGLKFMLTWRELIPSVFECDDIGELPELVEVNEESDGSRTFRLRGEISITEEDPDYLEGYRRDGYQPLLCTKPPLNDAAVNPRALDLAGLLAVKATEIVVPATKRVPADVVLEARSRLSDQLPPFWAAMLRLSRELQTDGGSASELRLRAEDLVDTVVRPTLVDLKRKLELEHKQWFHRLVDPLRAGLRLVAGRPAVSEHDLYMSAMLTGLDMSIAAGEHQRSVNARRADGGLAFLADAYDQLRR